MNRAKGTMRLTLIGSIVAAGALALGGCGGDDDESDITAFCDKVEEVRAAEDPFAGLAEDDLDGTREALEEARELFAEVAEVAPEEIQGDVEQTQQFFDNFVNAASDAETPQDFAAAATEFQQQAEEFEATSDRLEEYTDENCGPEEEEGTE